MGTKDRAPHALPVPLDVQRLRPADPLGASEGPSGLGRSAPGELVNPYHVRGLGAEVSAC